VEKEADNAGDTDSAIFPTEASEVAKFESIWGKCRSPEAARRGAR